MNFIDLLLLAVALGVDCLIVSFSQSIVINVNRFKNLLILAILMGLFQAVMPLISYYLTGTVYSYLLSISNWIVFSIFLILGIKFIIEAFNLDEDIQKCNILNLQCMLILGVATSIDALGAGVNMKFLNADIIFCTLIIGVVSFIMSGIGSFLGIKIRKIPSKNLTIIGGLILICLALKSLI